MRGIIGMRVNEIIDKLHEADFYIRRGSNLNQVQP